MEKDMVSDGKIRTKHRTVSSDSEDLCLIIDLDSEHREKDQKPVSRKKVISDSDDLCIDCEEDDTSVNFFVRAKEVQEFPLNPGKACKKFKFKFEPPGNECGNNVTLPMENCPKCNLNPDKNVLHTHMKDSLSNNILWCSDCPFATRDWSTIKRHKENHSLKNTTFKCSFCTFGTNSRFLNGQHLKLHSKASGSTKKEEFQCPLCPYAKSYVQTVAHFKVHAKRHQHLKNIMECPLCDVKTKSSTFGRHSKHHILYRPEPGLKLVKYGRPWTSRREKDQKDSDGEDKNIDEAKKTDKDGKDKLLGKPVIQQFQKRKQEIEASTLKSSEQCLRLLVGTEEVGVATAVALVEQTKQLENVNKQLDGIENSLDESQRNISKIKSVFGGMKTSLFGKKKKDLMTEAGSIQITKAGKNQETVKPKSSLQEKLVSYNGSPQDGGSATGQKSASEPKGSDFDSQFNANMNGMSNSLAMLKGLAIGIGEEIDSSTVLIETISYKTEGVTNRIEGQNDEIKKIMKK